MSLLGSVETLEMFVTQAHQEVVKYCLHSSVPHGGLIEKYLPAEMFDAMTDLVTGGLITSVQNGNKDLVFVPTLRAIFILSSKDYVECIASISRQWAEYEKATNVVCLSFGIIPQLKQVA